MPEDSTDDALDRMLAAELGGDPGDLAAEPDVMASLVGRARKRKQRRTVRCAATGLAFVAAVALGVAVFRDTSASTDQIQVRQSPPHDSRYSIFNREPTAEDALPGPGMYTIDETVGSRLAYQSDRMKVWVYKTVAGCDRHGTTTTAPCQRGRTGWTDASYCIEIALFTNGKVDAGGGACPSGALESGPAVIGAPSIHIGPPNSRRVAYGLLPDTVLAARYGKQTIPVADNVLVIDDVDPSQPLVYITNDGERASSFPSDR